ncbi:O-antigen ligase family protein [Mangrovibacterium marinum]|uniref:O-antigen ligase family protein n=1 Tax=Mangrovibacterium marinum TaxID=1639118 RepID=UPI002A18784F|nr:O-antigen ligase family protein [Mangrovibacterium marinum]
MKKSKQIILLCITIFTGSVFITSGKFVDATNTPKLYFVVVVLCVISVVFMIKRRINLDAFTSKTLFWGIHIICFLQAGYGFFQFMDWLPSNHSKFGITGSFDNPAGFAAVLAMGFPISLLLHTKAKKLEKCLTIIILMVFAIVVFLSGSRSGMLAIVISSVVLLLFKTNIVSEFRQLRHYKLLTVFLMVCFVVSLSVLYHQKKDSANGRLLIWKVSFEMIKDKPFFGHGYRAFQASYMDYQAEYFKNNPNSKYAQLADNVKHPFNEFIKFGVEFGIVGLIVVLSLFLFVLWKIIRSENEKRGLVFSGLVSFLVFACFSYPLLYIAVWLMLVFYLLVLLTPKETKIRNTPVSIVARIVVVVACVFSLFHVYQQIQAEIKWKTIAVNSLRGNTEKMLPEYEMLYSTSLKRNPYFLYNYGAELNFAGKFDKSIDILTECQQRFNDYDLQMLLADNYHRKGETEKAIQCYQHASNMILCRFLPTYQLFEIFKETGEKGKAVKYADKIINKNVKVPSVTISFIQREASEFLKGLKL